MDESDSISDDSDFGFDDNESLSGDEESETGTESESENEKTGNKASSTDEPELSKELVEFNKLVVLMRPLFKRARVQFINNTTRQMKKLKAKNGTPAQMEKNGRKCERLAQEIAYINRLKRDVVAKFALLHSKDELTKIIISPDSTMEYRVKAKVASSPVILQAAEKYHLEHPNWVEQLFKIVQLVGRNKKRKRRKLRGIGRTKKTNKTESDRVKIAMKTDKNSKKRKTDSNDDSIRFDESNFPEPPAELEQLMNLQNSKRANSSIVSNPLDGTITEYDAEDSIGATDITNDKPVIQNVKNIPAKPHNSNTPNVAKKQLNNSLPQTESNSKPCVDNSSAEKSKNSIPAVIKPRKKSSVDPFFMTSDNQEYKTLCPVLPANSAKPSSKNKDVKKLLLKKLTPFTDLKKGVSKTKVAKAQLNKGSKDLFKSGKITKQPTTSGPVQLHPSWQAKKKLQIVNAPFQGKKIVFDD